MTSYTYTYIDRYILLIVTYVVTIYPYTYIDILAATTHTHM